MTPEELKTAHEAYMPGSKLFAPYRMKKSGDTMKNFGIAGPITIERTASGRLERCWELYRKAPVKNGFQGSLYFSVKTFERILGGPLVDEPSRFGSPTIKVQSK